MEENWAKNQTGLYFLLLAPAVPSIIPSTSCSFCHLPLWLHPKPHTTTLKSGYDLFGYYFKNNVQFWMYCRSGVFCVHSSTYWVSVTQQAKFLTAHYLEVQKSLGVCITSGDPNYNCVSCNCCTISVYQHPTSMEIDQCLQTGSLGRKSNTQLLSYEHLRG